MAEQVPVTYQPPRELPGWRTLLATLAPILFLVVGILFSWSQYTSNTATSSQQAHTRFSNDEKRGLTEITTRMNTYADLLHSAHGLLVTNPNLNQVQWEEFVNSLNLSQHYPGMLGLGFVAYVPAGNLENFTAATRADNAPNFNVRPVSNRSDYFVVKYVEPRDKNSATLGLDLGADPAQRQAAEDARDTGMATLTPKLNLPQDPTAESGLIMLVPVYQSEMLGSGDPTQWTLSERQQDLLGWVYGALRTQDVFQGLLPTGQTDLDFEVYDSNNADPSNLLWDSDVGQSANTNPAITDRQQLTVSGRNWTIGVSTLSTFDTGQSGFGSFGILAAGAALSLLGALLLASFLNTQRSASALAERMTMALRESEERYRVITENAADLIAVVDKNNRRLYNSPSYKTVLGYTPEELARTSSLVQIHPDDRALVEQTARDALSTGTGRTIEYRMRHKDGSYLTLESISTIIRDARGQPGDLVIVGRDITARKRAEDSLRRQNEYLNALQSTTLALVAHLDLERLLNDLVARVAQLVSVKHGYITLVEPDGNEMTTRVGVGVFAEHIGDRIKPGQDLAGQVWQGGNPLTADDYQKLPTRQAGANLDTLHALAAFPLKSGERTVGVIGVADDRVASIFNQDELAALNQFAQLASVALDNARLYDQLEVAVQERTAELRQSEERYRTILENIEDGYFETDLRGNLTFFNDSLPRIVGNTRETLLGMNYRQYTGEATAKRLYEAFNQVYTTGQALRNFEYDIIGGDQALRSVGVSVSLIRDREGKGSGFRGVVRDVTAQHRAAKLQTAAYKISQQALTAPSLDAFYKGIHDVVGEFAYARNFYIAFYDEKQKTLTFPYFVDEKDVVFPPADQVVHSGHGVTAYVIRQKHTLHATAAEIEDLAKQGEIDPIGTIPVEWLGVPLKRGDEVFGVVVTQSYDPAHLFTAENRDDLTYLAEHISNAIERKQAEEALRESEERNRLLVQSSPDPVAIYDTDGNVTELNAAFTEIFGWTKEELLGKQIPFVPAAEAGSATALTEMLNKEGKVPLMDARRMTKAGQVLDVQLSASILRRRGGVPIGSILVLRDVSVRRRAELALQQQANYLAALQETTVAMVRRLDVNELLRDIVVRAGELLGTDDGYVYLLEPDEREMRLRVGTGLYDDLIGSRTHEGSGLAGLVWQTNQPLVLDDYQKWPQRLPGARRDLLRAVVGVPLRSGDRTLGVIGLAYTDEQRRFGESEMDVLSRFAQLAAVALDNAQLYGESESLYKATAELSVAKTYDDVIRVLEQDTVLGQNSQNVNISYFDRPWVNGQTPEWVDVLARSTTMPPELFAPRYSVESFPTLGALMDVNGPTLIEDTEKDPRMDENARALFAGLFHAKSAIFAPLVVGGQWIGFVNAHYPQPSTFNDASVRRLRTLTSQAAVVVQNIRQNEANVRLLEETQRQQTFLDSVVENLPVMVWIKDAKELRYVSINKAFEDILGLPRDQLLDKNAFDMFLPDEAARFETQDRAVVKSMQLLDVPEESVVSRTHGTRVIHTQKIPILDANKEPLYLLAIAEDITERKKTEEAVRRQNLYLAALQETTVGLVSRLDVNELLQDVVTRAASLIGTEHGYVYLLEPDGQEMKMRVGIGLYDNIIGTRMRPGSGLAGHVWQSAQPMVLDDYQKWPQRLPGARRDLLHGVVGVPLKSGERTVGVIGLAYTEEGRKFGETEMDVLNRFAQLASIALDNALLYQETQRTVTELTTLNRMSQGLATQLDMNAICRLVVEQLTTLFGASSGYIALYDKATDRIEIPYMLDQNQPTAVESMPLGEGLTSIVIKSGQRLLINNDTEKRAADLGAKVVGKPPRSYLAVPIVLGEEIIGALSVQTFEGERVLTEDNVNLLNTVAANAAVAIQNARLFAQTQQRVHELQLINTVSQTLAGQLDLQNLVRSMGDEILKTFGMTDGYIALYNEKTNRLDFPYNMENGVNVPHSGLEMGQGVTSHIIKTGQPLLLNHDSERQAAKLGAMHWAPTQSYLGVPIVYGDRTIGVINVQSEREGLFGEADIRLLSTIAATAGVAIQNARLFEQTQERAREMSALHDAARAMGERLEPDQLFETVYNHVQRLMPLDAFFIATYNEKSDLLTYNFEMDEGLRYPDETPRAPEGRTKTALEGGEPILTCKTPDEMERIYAGGGQGMGTGKVCVSAMFIPIKLGSRALGVMSIQSYKFDAYDSHHAELAGNLANGLAVALDNARLFQAVQMELEERRRAERDLVRFKLGIDRSNDAMFITDVNGKITYANPAFEKVYGYKPDEALGQTPRLIKSGVVPQEQYKAFWGTLLSKQVVAGEIINKTKEGRLVPIDGVNNPILDEDGSLLGFFGIHRDITERKRAAEAAAERAEEVQRANARLLDAVANLDAGFVMYGPDERLVICNSRYKELYPASAKLMVPGAPYEDILHASYRAGNYAYTGMNEDEWVASRLRLHRAAGAQGAYEQRVGERWIRINDARSSDGGVVSLRTDITERKRQEAELQQQAVYLTALQETSLGLVSRLDVNELLRDIVTRAGDLVGTDNGYVYLAEPGGEEMRMHVGTGLYDDLVGSRTRPGAGLAGIVWESGEPFALEDYQKWDQRLTGARRDLLRGVVGVPLVSGDRTVGVIGLAYTEAGRRFGPTELQVLTRFASLAAIALDNARLYQETQQRVGELDTLNRLSQALTSQLDIHGVSQLVVEQLKQIFPDPNAYVVSLYDKATKMIEIPYSVDRGEIQSVAPFPLGQGLASHIIRTCEPLLINRDTAKRMEELGAINIGDPAKSYLGVPILVGDQVIGTISIQSIEQEGLFGDNEIRLLSTVSATAGVALRNAQLFEETRRAQSFLDSVVENMPNMIWVRDAQDLRYLSINKTFEDTLGIPRTELLGKSAFDMFQPDEAKRLESRDRDVIKSKRLLDVPEESIVSRTRGARIIHTQEIPIYGSGGEPIYLLAIAEDITERKKVEEERAAFERKLLETQKLESLGVLAGGIAHDFNNLLVSILGNVGLALLDLEPSSLAREPMEQIKVAAQRAADLTKQMLAYSGKGRFVMQRISVNSIIEEMTQLLKVSISKSAVLRLNLTTGLPLIEADATQIRQIVMNLIVNASDAIGAKDGIVTLSTGVVDADQSYLSETFMAPELGAGKYVYLEVADTGIGMDAETRKKIFEPFFTTKFTGRGLGLAAVLGIVRGHKGAIWVYSEVGQGTKFRILLPCLEDTSHMDEGQKTVPSARGSGTVLVIDDEDVVRSVTKRMLQRFGYSVMMAPDGREGIEIYKANRDEVSLVLLDLTMPHMNGEETFRELRQFNPEARVLLMSGYTEQEATGRFAGKGLAGFLQKPYTPQELHEKIQGILRGKD